MGFKLSLPPWERERKLGQVSVIPNIKSSSLCPLLLELATHARDDNGGSDGMDIRAS